MNKKLNIPKFRNEDAERAFWSELDLSAYFEKKDFKPVIFPNLKPSTKAISIRIPEYLLYELKAQANKSNVPYQSLIKTILEKSISKS